jgi:hypothetical protein
MPSSERVLHNSHRFSLPWNRLCDPLRLENEVRMAEVLGDKQEAPSASLFCNKRDCRYDSGEGYTETLIRK